MRDDDPSRSGEARPPWRPSMTRAEAVRWARESVYRSPVFHATTRESADSIRREGFDVRRHAFGHAWGNAVYGTPDRTVASVYRSVVADSRPVVLEMLISVRAILIIEAKPGDTHTDVRNRILAGISDGFGEWTVATIRRLPYDGRDAAALAFRDVLRAAGYDALEIREATMSPEIGGTRVVVFDARNVVVIDDD